jgi:hypothetical protein
MGHMHVNPYTPALTGKDITATDTGGSTSTLYIEPTTAQSVLDFSRLVVVFENYSSTASCAITLEKGEDFSAHEVGDAAAVTLGTAETLVIGGHDFESARFQNDDGGCEFTITTAGTLYVRAIMLPSATS